MTVRAPLCFLLLLAALVPIAAIAVPVDGGRSGFAGPETSVRSDAATAGDREAALPADTGDHLTENPSGSGLPLVLVGLGTLLALVLIGVMKRPHIRSPRRPS